jgi:hypothetical protein
MHTSPKHAYNWGCHLATPVLSTECGPRPLPVCTPYRQFFGIQQLLQFLILSIIVGMSGRLNRPGVVVHVDRRSAARYVRPIYISTGESKIYILMQEQF